VRAVIQKVSSASVSIKGNVYSKIDKGLLVLLGVGKDDSESSIEKLGDKIVNLRIFPDKNDKMNLSLIDIGGEMLVISQFTLFANIKKGRRPSFTDAAKPEIALQLYKKFCSYLETYDITVKQGVFGEIMEVDLCNDGPVTLTIDEEKDL